MANIGFIGAGGIARAHAFSLNALKYYYNDAPEVNFISVTSSGESSRTDFAKKYQFPKAQTLEDFVKNKNIDTVFILGPNKVHFEHLNLALDMPKVKNIYLEKPVCSSKKEENQMKSILKNLDKEVKIQVGFQYPHCGFNFTYGIVAVP